MWTLLSSVSCVFPVAGNFAATAISRLLLIPCNLCSSGGVRQRALRMLPELKTANESNGYHIT
jgi:hypothetical protein